MSKKSFDNFGLAAKRMSNYTVMASRYAHQSVNERRIIVDLQHKLDLKPNDTLLEIGCNSGTLLIPLSFLVRQSFAVDHEDCLKVLTARFNDTSIVSMPGNFLDLQFEEKFNKILIYSVLHYLSDESELMDFVDKAMDILAPGGRLLLGDIPNSDKRERFRATEQGRRWLEEFDQHRQEAKLSCAEECISQGLTCAEKDSNCVAFGDDLVFSILRRARCRGFESYLLEQHPLLPFGPERDDILICATECFC
ncbi:MAG: class I SAM-dependent methyltransferase [Desulfovibrionaceae bacterium]